MFMLTAANTPDTVDLAEHSDDSGYDSEEDEDSWEETSSGGGGEEIKFEESEAAGRNRRRRERKKRLKECYESTEDQVIRRMDEMKVGAVR